MLQHTKTMPKQKITLFVLLLSLLIFCQTVHSKPLIKYEGYRDTWNKVTYEILEENKRQHYTNLLMEEMNKYPKEYFDKIDLQVIVLVKDLKFDNVYRAAVPDNYNRILFIGIKNDYTDDYIRHVYHHEKNHYAEFCIWGNYRYVWDEWNLLFDGVGGGGELAYQSGGSKYSMTFNRNLKGFLNAYSTLGQEEDRSEMVAFFLTDHENRLFMEKANNDNVFYQKAILLFTLFKDRLAFPDLLQRFLSGIQSAPIAALQAQSTATQLPQITVVNNTSADISRIYVIKTTDTEWGNSLLNQTLQQRQSITLTLPYQVNQDNRYHILLMDQYRNSYIKENIKISGSDRIEFTNSDFWVR